MTTKKQRREMTAAKRAAFDAEMKRIGLEAQRRDQAKREQRKFDAERAEKKKATALKMRKQHEAAELAKQIKIEDDITVGEFLDVAEAYRNAILRSGQASFGLAQSMGETG